MKLTELLMHLERARLQHGDDLNVELTFRDSYYGACDESVDEVIIYPESNLVVLKSNS